MPYTIHTAKAKIRDAYGNFRSIDVFSNEIEDTRQAAIQAVNDAKTAAINVIDDRANAKISPDVTNNEVEAMLAPIFDSATAYSAGTYVRNADGSTNKLYKITADHAAGVTWPNTSKVEVKVGSQVADVRNAFAQQRSGIKYLRGGYYATGLKAEASNDAVSTEMITGGAVVTVTEGIVYRVLLYNNGQYIGKINTSYGVDTSAGNWYSFSGTTDMYKLLAEKQADAFVLVILVSGSDTPTESTYQAWGESHCAMYTGAIYGIGDVRDRFDDLSWEVDGLKSARNNIDGTIQYTYIPDAYITVNQNVNVSVPLTPVESTGAGYVIIDCSPGDAFLISGKGWNASRVYAFLTSENKMILKAVSGADINGLVITAPNNAAKLVVNNVDSSHSHYVIKLSDLKQKTDLSDANEIYTRGAEISNTVTENTFVDFETGIRTFTNHPECCTAEYSVTPDSYYYVTGSCQYADHSVYRLVDADGDYSYSYDSTDRNVVSLTNELVYIPKGVTKIQIASVKGASNLSLYPALLSKDGLPSYYYENGYFQNKLKEIQSGMDFSYGICFAFITDTHWPSNSGHSKNMLAQIMKKTSVPFVIFGGDLAPAYADEDNLNRSVGTLFDYMDAVGAENWYNVHGNHDIYSRESRESSTYHRKTLAECYNIMMRKQERIIGNGDPYHCYYYFDIASPDTRIIVLNSSDITTPNGSCAYTKWQVKGLATHLQSVSNKKIIIISHLSPDSVLADTEANDTKDVRDLLSAYQNRSTFTYDGTTYDFSSANNKIIFSLAGHSHSDGYHFENNILSVTTTCDAYYKDDGYNATPGTITEQAFDIFYIDYNNKTVKTIRVGRGNNRAWNYETGEVVT